MASSAPALQRSLNLPLLVLYGLGTTVGGGIYVLVGIVVQRAGIFAPISLISVLAVVNGALLRIKLRLHGAPSPDHLTVPIWVPAIGLVVSLFFADLAGADLLL